MSLKNYALFLYLYFLFLPLKAQNLEFDGRISVLGLSGSNDILPFWLYHNTFGRIEPSTNAFTVLSSSLDIERGSNYLVFGAGVLFNDGLERQVRADEFYLGYQWKFLGVEGGLKQPIEKYDGIASVNTDMIWNNNARPRPGVRFYTVHPVALTMDKRLLFEAEYGDFWLDDTRYMMDARFHAKSLAFIYRLNRGWEIKGGLRHTVMWGGNSPRFGKQPEGLDSYIRVVMSLPGGKGATESDQINTLGNAVSGYYFHLSKKSENWYAEFIWNNLQEDASGRNLSNLPDGRYALYLKNHSEESWFKSLIYEFIYTKSQSSWAGPSSDDDNYFNNGEYNSGYTYYGDIIGSPFFIVNKNGLGVVSNRFVVHHIGLKFVKNALSLKSKMSFRKHYSTPFGEYNGPKNISSMSLDFNWINSISNIHLILGGDFSNVDTNLAIGLGLSKMW